MTKTQYWQQQIDLWSASNLSQKEFCKEQSLKFYTFQYWLRKLSEPKPVDSGFIPVTVQPSAQVEVAVGSVLIRCPTIEVGIILKQLEHLGFLNA